MENNLMTLLVISNLLLIYIVRELWKDNKKKSEVMRLQDNWLKMKGIIKKY